MYAQHKRALTEALFGPWRFLVTAPMQTERTIIIVRHLDERSPSLVHELGPLMPLQDLTEPTFVHT